MAVEEAPRLGKLPLVGIVGLEARFGLKSTHEVLRMQHGVLQQVLQEDGDAVDVVEVRRNPSGRKTPVGG